MKYNIILLLHIHKYFITSVIFCLLYSWRGINRNKIVISSHAGRIFCCNPRYIVEEILRQKLPYEIVWLVSRVNKNDEIYPKSIKFVDHDNIFQKFKELSTAKLWIDNSYKVLDMKRGLKKKKEQKYLNTWHGSLGIKRIVLDTDIFKKDRDLVKALGKDMNYCDVMTSNSKFEEDVFSSALGFQGHIERIGHPRNDIFFLDATKIKKEVYDYFKIEKNQKLALYAPTFRNGFHTSCYDIDYKRLKNTLEEKFNCEWIIASRFHHITLRAPHSIIEKISAPIDASFYSDMQKLMVSSDLLISDYSSCMFDYMLSKRPCFVYAKDINEYNSERGFYYSLEETPFPIAKNNDELIENIKNFNLVKYKEDCKNFLEAKEVLEDGNASKRAVEIIKKLMS